MSKIFHTMDRGHHEPRKFTTWVNEVAPEPKELMRRFRGHFMPLPEA